MKSALLSRTGLSIAATLVVAVSGSFVLAQATKEKNKPAAKGTAKPAESAKSTASAKPAASAKSAAKSTAKTPSANDAKLNQHLAANMKFFGVLSRYAQTLSGARNATTAHQAIAKLEAITKDAITAGDALVKLGKPDPETEMKLATDADLKMTSQNVAEQTRAAVKSLAANAEVKTILAPAVENFQAALNRMQQAADEPPQAISKTPAGAPDTNSPAPAPPPPPGDNPAATAADATEVPPPPPPQ